MTGAKMKYFIAVTQQRWARSHWHASPRYDTFCGCLHRHATRVRGYDFGTSFNEGPSVPRRVGRSDEATASKASIGSDILTKWRATHRENSAKTLITMKKKRKENFCEYMHLADRFRWGLVGPLSEAIFRLSVIAAKPTQS